MEKMVDLLALILALEPEAASLCCRQNRKELKFESGTKYMVVDCGGGTVDIAVHEIDEQGNTNQKQEQKKILSLTQLFRLHPIKACSCGWPLGINKD